MKKLKEEGQQFQAEIAKMWAKAVAVVNNPSPTQVYPKDMYKGLIIEGTKRTGGLKSEGTQVWASQDRDPFDRAARKFYYGLKRLFKKQWGGCHET